MDVENVKNGEPDDALDIAALLCEARDNLGLTSEGIAKELNLANEIVSEIENNHFDQGIPTAFIRGYVKSYATRVGLNVEPILHKFDQLSGVEVPSLKRVQVISSFGKRRKEINSSNYLFKTMSVLIVLLFISFAAWEVWKRYFAIQDLAQTEHSDISTQLNISNESSDLLLQNESDDTGGLEPIIEQTDEGLSNDQQIALNVNQSITEQEHLNTNDLESSNNTTSASSVFQSSMTDLPSNTESSPLVESSNLTSLVLDFSDECWVKIVDARGAVIAEGVKVSGKHMPVEGVAPFNVILGNPSAVTMNYDGQDYDLSRYSAGQRAQIVLN